MRAKNSLDNGKPLDYDAEALIATAIRAATSAGSITVIRFA